MEHVIFFDDECSLCRKSVQMILKIDHAEIFSFAPLEGDTAARVLPHLLKNERQSNTLILVENYGTKKQRVWLFGRAVFRVFWLLGEGWSLLGWICFIPFGVDSVYRLIANHRNSCSVTERYFSEDDKHRFLP